MEQHIKWCLDQADELERNLPERDADSAKTMAEVAVDWLRDFANKLAGVGCSDGPDEDYRD